VRAALLHAWDEPFKVEEVPTPEPGPGEVRVRIGGAGACHSDLHFKAGAVARPGLPPAPWILGHENAGWVDALGAGADGVEVGQPVAVFGGWGCGRCRLCLGGEEQLCDTRRWGGIGRPGGYAEALIVPSTRHLIPIDGLDPVDVAPLTDAALTPYRAVNKTLSRLVPGATAVVIGAGGLGQFGIQLLRALSPARVVVVDTSETKRLLATSLGADLVLDPTVGDPLAHIHRFAGSEGPAAVIDFVGVDTTIELALAAVGRKGLAVIVGLGGGSAPFSFLTNGGEATVTTSNWGSRNELEEVIALARAGAISARIERHDLGEINEVFTRLERGQVEGRAVLTP
jgi:alcohol dehydrogenase, propanol-preferring